MFKRISHITLMFLLIISTTGIAVSKHYCNSTLVSTSFFSESESCCNSENCCHNESQFIKLDEDFSTPSLSELPDITEIKLSALTENTFCPLYEENKTKGYLTVRKPPPKPDLHTLLSLNQVYIL